MARIVLAELSLPACRIVAELRRRDVALIRIDSPLTRIQSAVFFADTTTAVPPPLADGAPASTFIGQRTISRPGWCRYGIYYVFTLSSRVSSTSYY